MLEFIQLLKHRYQTITQLATKDIELKSNYQAQLDSLTLAQAFIQKGKIIEALPRHALQIAILGPTQAGKSSVTNLLLNNNVAGVSPLAGFTIHPQGFLCQQSEADNLWLKDYFSNFQQQQQQKLESDNYHHYSLTRIDSKSTILPNCILWDTPDFDSIDANSYREGVLTTAALADIIVLVVSKEKYADQSVWEMMHTLAALNQPTLIIVNKLLEDSQQLILDSLQEKWKATRNDPFPLVIPLLYQKQGVLEITSSSEIKRITKLFKTLINKSNRRKHNTYEQQLLSSHWQNWIEPVIAEHQVLQEWQKLLDDSVKEALAHYQRDYLNHPHHYETFQAALVELLTLLEIPGIASVLAKTRRVLTWPVRQVFKLGKVRKISLTDNSHEIVLLQQISEHTLIKLTDKLLDKIEESPEQQQWWKDINRLLRKQRPQLLASFQQNVLDYHADFHQQIEQTARRLYVKLEEQPLTLNSLRATRITTDAAAIGLALKTGGIGLHDLIITPAMLSITSLLAESALGGYMSKVELELKQQQLAAVKQQLFIEHLQDPLQKLPSQMQSPTHFNISKQQLHNAEQQLTKKPHGLRLF